MHGCGISIVQHSAYGSIVICWNRGEKRGNTCEVDLRQTVVGGKADTACIDGLRRSAGPLIGCLDPVRRFASFHHGACLLLLFWLLPITCVLGDAEIGYFRLCSHVRYSLIE